MSVGNYFKNLYFSLTGRITMAIFFISSGIILILGVIFIWFNTQTVLKNRHNAIDSNLQTTANTLNNTFELANNISIQLLANSVILEALSQPEYDYINNMNLYNKVIEGIRNTSKFYTAISRINLYAKNGFFYNISGERPNQSKSYEEAAALYRQNGIMEGDSIDFPKWCVIYEDGDTEGRPGKYSFVNVRSLYHPKSYENLCLLEIEINDAYLQNIYLSMKGNSMLVNRDGFIISSNNSSLKNQNISSSPMFGKLKDMNQRQGHFILENDLITYLYIPVIESYLIFSEKYTLFLPESKNIINNTLILITACLLLSVLCARLVSKRLTKSLSNLKNTMQEVSKGNLKLHYAGAKEMETRELGEFFNNMLDQINNYIHEIRMQEEQNKTTELKLLQSQINPHLLYNTLDSVLWKLEKRDMDSAVKLLSVMSEFFKISLSKGADIVSIRQEIEHIDKYLKIQKLSRKKSYILDIDGELSLMECLIAKTTFQPIIENVVLHGFEGYGDSGKITILLNKLDSNKMLIIIEDNGLGIEEEQLIALNQSLQLSVPNELSRGFGLWNVQQRIKKYFGDEFGLEVESVLGEYTRVKIYISCILNNVSSPLPLRRRVSD